MLDIAGATRRGTGARPPVGENRGGAGRGRGHPLLGEHGAAAVFAPQKGADPGMVVELDAALTVLRDRLAGALGPRAPGAGAAGGVGYATLAVLGAVAAAAPSSWS